MGFFGSSSSGADNGNNAKFSDETLKQIQDAVDSAVQRQLEALIPKITADVEEKLVPKITENVEQVMEKKYSSLLQNLQNPERVTDSMRLSSPGSPLSLSQRRNLPDLRADTGNRMGKNTRSSAEGAFSSETMSPTTPSKFDAVGNPISSAEAATTSNPISSSSPNNKSSSSQLPPLSESGKFQSPQNAANPNKSASKYGTNPETELPLEQRLSSSANEIGENDMVDKRGSTDRIVMNTKVGRRHSASARESQASLPSLATNSINNRPRRLSFQDPRKYATTDGSSVPCTPLLERAGSKPMAKLELMKLKDRPEPMSPTRRLVTTEWGRSTRRSSRSKTDDGDKAPVALRMPPQKLTKTKSQESQAEDNQANETDDPATGKEGKC